MKKLFAQHFLNLIIYLKLAKKKVKLSMKCKNCFTPFWINKVNNPGRKHRNITKHYTDYKTVTANNFVKFEVNEDIKYAKLPLLFLYEKVPNSRWKSKNFTKIIESIRLTLKTTAQRVPFQWINCITTNQKIYILPKSIQSLRPLPQRIESSLKLFGDSPTMFRENIICMKGQNTKAF